MTTEMNAEQPRGSASVGRPSTKPDSEDFFSTLTPSLPKPLVSIIMPAYNAGRFIGEAIRSVLDQTYPHWELIVIDDGSSDRTAEIVRQFEDERIRLIQIAHTGSNYVVRNYGLLAATGRFSAPTTLTEKGRSHTGKVTVVRNKGLEKAVGDMIAFLDADDVFYPDALEKLVTALLENPRLTAVYGFHRQIDEYGRPFAQQSTDLIPDPDRPGQFQTPSSAVVNWENLLLFKQFFYLPALVLWRETLERVGFFQEDFRSGEDYLFFIRLFLDDWHGVQCIPDYVYQYRMYSGSLTKDPARVQTISQSIFQTINWIYRLEQIPEHLRKLKPSSVAIRFRQEAYGRLLRGERYLAWRLALQALNSGKTNLFQWVRHCLPVLLLSILPDPSLNRFHDRRVTWRYQQEVRQLYQRPQTPQRGWPNISLKASHS